MSSTTSRGARREEAEDELAALDRRPLEVAGVMEEEFEGSTRREKFLPLAHEELDVRERAQSILGDRRALGVALDGHDAPRRRRHRRRALAERRPGFAYPLPHGEHGQELLHLAKRGAAVRHATPVSSVPRCLTRKSPDLG